jgi:hypothetical protein
LFHGLDEFPVVGLRAGAEAAQNLAIPADQELIEVPRDRAAETFSGWAWLYFNRLFARSVKSRKGRMQCESGDK